MKWNELQNCTWGELCTLTWNDLKNDKTVILEKVWNGEITLTPEAESKFLLLCEPILNQFQEKYNVTFREKFSAKDILISSDKYINVLANIITILCFFGIDYEKAYEITKDLFDQFVTILSNLF